MLDMGHLLTPEVLAAFDRFMDAQEERESAQIRAGGLNAILFSHSCFCARLGPTP